MKKQIDVLNAELALIAIPLREATDTYDAIAIEATVLALDDGAFARLTSAVRCGGGSNGGMSGFDDSKRLFVCPAYGQA